MTPNSLSWICRTPETLLTGLGRVSSDNPDLPALPELEECRGNLFYGYVYGLKIKFPDDVLWDEPNAGKRLLALSLPLPGVLPAWYLLGLFAGSGDTDFFGELVRRAKHRDGSTGSIGLGTEALHALGALVGIPEAEQLFTAFSFDPANVAVGDYPNEGITKKLAGVSVGLEGNSISTGSSDTSGGEWIPFQPPASNPAPDPPPPFLPVLNFQPVEGMPAVLVSLGDTPDVTTGQNGRVYIGSSIPLSLTVVNELINRLMVAYRSLTLPAEGFAWFDDTLNPLSGSELCILDPYVVKVLDLPWSADKGVCIAAKILQNNSGEYLGVVNQKGGGERTLEPEADLNQAKVEVCKVFQASLKDAGL